MDENSVLKIDGLSVKFCGKNVDPPAAMSYCLPVMIHTCPDDFSTLDYFDVNFYIFFATIYANFKKNSRLSKHYMLVAQWFIHISLLVQ